MTTAYLSSDCVSSPGFAVADESSDYLLDHESPLLHMSTDFLTARPWDGSLVLGVEIRIYTRSIDSSVQFRRQLTSLLPFECVCSGSLVGLFIGVCVTFVRRFNRFPASWLVGFSLNYHSDCGSLFLHLATAFPVACSSDCLSDCLSDCVYLFSHMSTAIPAYHTTDYSSNCLSY